jgi:hypothetical protein
MGAHKNITAEIFPKQGSMLNKNVKVCFHYDTSKQFDGMIIRDDVEEPFLTIIKLEDNRIVLGSECQYS